MDTYRTEEEQVEFLKQWWKNYGSAIISGLIIALLITVAWRYWQSYQSEQAEIAASHFHALINHVDDQEQVSTQAFVLMTSFKHSPYAALATLFLAKNDVASDNYDAVGEALNWAIENSRDPIITDIARVRLARILLMQGKLDEAMDLDEADSVASYRPVIDELRGDIYRAKGDHNSEALAAYQNAIVNYQQDSQIYQLLNMKMNELSLKGTVENFS